MVSQDPAIRPSELGCTAAVVRQSAVARMCAVLMAGIAAAFALALSTTARAATITVDSLADTGASSICVLRDAITAANTMTATNGCAAGTGNDTIRFSVTGTIVLANTLPQVTDSQLTINGPISPGITIDGGSGGYAFQGVQVMQVASGASLNLKSLTIAHGFSHHKGGGILNKGILTIINSTFYDNGSIVSADLNSKGNGGGIANDGTLTVTNTTFLNNYADCVGSCDGAGGGISNDGTLKVVNSTFSDNSSFGSGPNHIGDGGAIYNSGRLTVINGSFSDNNAGAFGGGIDNDGTLTVTNSRFSENSVDGDGGGIENTGTLTVINTIFSDNSVGGFGGAIGNNGTLTVTNSTFSHNSGGSSGAIGNDGTLTVTNSTLSGNDGAGIDNSGSASFKSTILAGNTIGYPSGPANCSGTITDAGYDISDDATCGFNATGSRNSTNPLLDPAGLQNNGGPTKTIALDSESPAIDAIPIANCTDQVSNRIITDQRGALRPDVGEVYCDIGAYEFQDLAGQPNCHGKSVSALVHQFGSIKAAAAALGFSSVTALQRAIGISCGG
jgi:hypothetical protein